MANTPISTHALAMLLNSLMEQVAELCGGYTPLYDFEVKGNLRLKRRFEVRLKAEKVVSYLTLQGVTAVLLWNRTYRFFKGFTVNWEDRALELMLKEKIVDARVSMKREHEVLTCTFKALTPRGAGLLSQLVTQIARRYPRSRVNELTALLKKLLESQPSWRESIRRPRNMQS